MVLRAMLLQLGLNEAVVPTQLLEDTRFTTVFTSFHRCSANFYQGLETLRRFSAWQQPESVLKLQVQPLQIHFTGPPQAGQLLRCFD